jgi:regulator of protease activity HflC (stomatin/prohibitin superfamily)
MRQISDGGPSGQGSSLMLGGWLTIGAVVVSILIAFWSYYTVDAGHVAVIKRFGAVQEGYYGPGLHFKNPLLDSVVHVNTQLSSVEAKAGAASKDMQVVTTEVSVPYYLQDPQVPTMINALGSREVLAKSVLATAIQESVKSATAGYTAEELLTRRNEVKAKIVSGIVAYVNDTLRAKKIEGLVGIANVGITDFDFSPDFNKAIEQKVRMQQDALRAEIEKTKRITEAEAKFAEAKLSADGEAYKTKTEAEARIFAIEGEGKAIRENPGIVPLRIAERWDGTLPKYNSSTLPMFMMQAEPETATPTSPTRAATR